MTCLSTAQIFLLAMIYPAAALLKAITSFIYYAFLSRPRSLSNIRKYHPVALVFGASSGIGRAFSLALSSRGFEVVVVARREALLKTLCAEIVYAGGKCTMMTCDAANSSEIDALFGRINASKLGVAVYASGVCNKIPEYLENLDDAETRQTLAVNVEGMVRFSQNAARILKNNRKGLICLFSSETGLYPSPMMTVYGGTKAFTANFAVALNEECRSRGVQVIAAAPFWVASEMTMTTRTSWRMAGARPFVERLLAGNFRRVVINPWWSHKLLAITLANRFGTRIQHSGMQTMRGKVIRKLKKMQDAQVKENAAVEYK